MRLAHPAGVFEIESLPSQPQVAHCHAFFVYPKMRGKGLGHVLKKFQMSTMHYLGYDYATETDVSGEIALFGADLPRAQEQAVTLAELYGTPIAVYRIRLEKVGEARRVTQFVAA